MEARRFADRGKPFNLEAGSNVRAGLNLNGRPLVDGDIMVHMALAETGKEFVQRETRRSRHGRITPDVADAGTERADIAVSFDISSLDDVVAWLREHDMGNGDECLLRRVLVRNGRSRAYVNGTPVTQALLAEFIGTLEIPDGEKKRLLALTPQDYIGLAVDLARQAPE